MAKAQSLSDIAHVVRGIATGANNFFVLSDGEVTKLNSTLSKDSLRVVGRSYGSDTVKIEPREMDRLPVINPLQLPGEARQRLAALFDRLCNTRTEEAERSIRRAISKIIALL